MSFFYDIGLVTSTMGAQSVPFADGAPQAVSAANTITLPTNAAQASAAANFYQGMAVAVVSGQGAGAVREIIANTTGLLATVAAWDAGQVPNTSSSVVVGIPLKGHDMLAVKAEAVSSASSNTAVFRTDQYSFDGFQQSLGQTPRRIVGSSFACATISSATAALSFATAAFHCVSAFLDALTGGVIEGHSVAKIFIDTAPSGNLELYLMPSYVRGPR